MPSSLLLVFPLLPLSILFFFQLLLLLRLIPRLPTLALLLLTCRLSPAHSVLFQGHQMQMATFKPKQTPKRFLVLVFLLLLGGKRKRECLQQECW